MKNHKSCLSCFKVLGIPSRMEIYAFVKGKGRASVSDVVGKLKLRQPTISYHLKEMYKSGVLQRSRVGKKVFYEINVKCPHIEKLCILSEASL